MTRFSVIQRAVLTANVESSDEWQRLDQQGSGARQQPAAAAP